MAKVTTDLTELTSQLPALYQQSSQVSAVSLKLPEFWTKSPDVWFARVEAQFGTKGITQDQTQYDYVVSALDLDTAEEVQSILIHPPATEKYSSLKRALIKTFGKSQAQKDNELLNINGLGDKRPTALLRKINALNDDPQTLKRALFLSNLPEDVRSILAGHSIADIEALAEAADRIWETRTPNVHHVEAFPSFDHNVQSGSSSEQFPINTPVDAVYTGRKHPQLPRQDRPNSSTFTSASSVCYYHSRFGPDARRCKPGCKFARLLKSNTGQPFLAENDKAGR